jgi:hypothetical protein
MHDGPRPEGPGTPLLPVTDLDGVADIVTADLLHRYDRGRVGAAHDPGRLATALERALAWTTGPVTTPP